jgi:hypothetical protein
MLYDNVSLVVLYGVVYHHSMAPSYSKLLVITPLILMSIGMIATPIAMGLTTTSQTGAPSQGTLIGTSTINVNGTVYPLDIYRVPSNPGATPAAGKSTSYPFDNGGSVSPLTGSDWQYGAQWAPSSTYYGAALTINYFDSQSSSTPSFSYWLGLTDNSNSCSGGCFYQAGIDWYSDNYLGLCFSYVGWSLDSNSGLTTPNNCLPGTAQWGAYPITSGSENVLIFLYSHQWYSDFYGTPESGAAPSGANAFPGGAHSATKVVGASGGISEGWTTSGFSTYGEGVASQFQYVTSVTYSSGTYFVSLSDATTSISNFYQTTGSGAPPSSAQWYVGGSCPYTYDSYFYTGGSYGLPGSSGSAGSVSAC